MRGKPNTDVKLTVLRKCEQQPLEFIVRRDGIRVKASRHACSSRYGGSHHSVQEHTGENRVTINDLYSSRMASSRAWSRPAPQSGRAAQPRCRLRGLPAERRQVYTDGRTEDAKMRLTAAKEN
jgi:carboxyl-terminal processing protease